MARGVSLPEDDDLDLDPQRPCGDRLREDPELRASPVAAPSDEDVV